METVILANGAYPTHSVPLSILAAAPHRICCDGAAQALMARGIRPDAVVGDLDSLPPALRRELAPALHHVADQETNDLTKAVRWAAARGYRRAAILGATGKRDDHALGNIALLPSYAAMGLDISMVTDTGTFRPLAPGASPARIGSRAGQPVSIFATRPDTRVSSRGLRYPLGGRALPELWMGTLNVALGDSYELDFGPGPIIVFNAF